MCGVGINCSLSSFPTHQHRHTSMERTNKQENNIGGERPPNSAACQFGVWLHAQVDDPTESQHHDKSQVIGNPYRKFVFSTVRLVGRQRDDLEGKQRYEDAQPDRLGKVQLVDVERGADEPAPRHHNHKSLEEDSDDKKEKLADNVASPSSVIVHDEPFSSPGRECPCFIKNTALTSE